ncbi:hypothetical protein NBRC111894_1530 [Sporolactobacillus inulinus]|uniref:Uncharacterized protein n=1 Tax=Sporolactobacillus inulinus TaxID=2078 RepID=A0A4Y1ZAA5_9BACL|nr:hypothetical protein NBRC111894_1530 [Sporolactobacillus inulinus]
MSSLGAESSLRLLACRGRTASLLRQGKNLRGLAGTHQQGAIPQAPEHLRVVDTPLAKFIYIAKVPLLCR